MTNSIYRAKSNGTLVLSATGIKSLSFQLGMVFAAVVLPAVAHLSGAPVRWLLPMHWPIVLAALVYGWRGGLTVGVMAPATNYLLTGYPLLVKAFPMTFELVVYGLIIGWLREVKGWNSFAAVATGLVAGRIIFLCIILLTGANEVPFREYLIAAMLPGLVAAVLQVGVLPMLSKVLTKGRQY